ncbi:MULTISPECIES: spermidine synthase [unclassified Rhizobacter]|uniref:spermine/spermidine synthase domain-containing protein n=1 Tax=unclassified Rhizobacter TaxID=2640088 RepID=UPI0006FAB471|nr:MULTISPECIES: spermidine synthase [unclassified Rhizobacter]KQU81496.1 spermidine synthase [Rhizobacter sp. Root29]KQW12174.1 spermidine synthase [Rhizobacter sp. Root1238]KRB02989.1 spermidine synthase [Rhizobacter sp. Root16D2]
MPARPTPEPELVPATLSEADGVRYLHLGTPWVQGAMRVRKPNVIELDYVQRMMVWLLLIDPEALGEGHAVQLGLGAAAITRFTRRLGMRTTAVELNPTVITACRLWFKLPEDDDRLQVLNQDAGRWVADPANAGSVQVLCVDLYDHEAASPVLDDDAFYQACHRVLADGGVMTVNLFGRDASYEQSAARIAGAFGAAAVWSMRPTREGNTVVVGMKGLGLPSREVLAARADNIENRCDLPARKWLRMIRNPNETTP